MKIITAITASAMISMSGLASPSVAKDFPDSHFVPARSSGTAVDCVAEASAFTEVADLAYLYREDGGVFAGAIEELRDQLLDCLATFDDSDGRSAFPAESDRLKLI